MALVTANLISRENLGSSCLAFPKELRTVAAGLSLVVKTGDLVKIDQALNSDPNVGGFGQEETEIVLQNPIRIIGYLGFCLCVLLTQILLILKKKQFEKVQAAELNF